MTLGVSQSKQVCRLGAEYTKKIVANNAKYLYI